MRSLLLLRHAKAVPGDGDLDDRDRPLNHNGREAADAVARYLAKRGYSAARVLCSPSLRTVETLAHVRASLCADAPESLDDALYLAGAARLLERIASLDDAEPSTLVIGHNPGIQQLACSLANDGEPRALARLARGFPTGSCAVIGLAGERWVDAPLGGRLLDFVRPKDLCD